jgi:hypothetical protein
MGIALLVGAFPDDGKGQQPPAFVGLFFVGFASVFIIIGWTIAIATFLAGRNIGAHKKYTFCFVMAVIACAFAPLGTILGVFTIIVLLRDSVKNLFNGNLSAPPVNQSFDQPNWR